MATKTNYISRQPIIPRMWEFLIAIAVGAFAPKKKLEKLQDDITVFSDPTKNKIIIERTSIIQKHTKSRADCKDKNVEITVSSSPITDLVPQGEMRQMIENHFA